MDDARFQEARQAYEAGDHRLAAKLFASAAGEGADGNGTAHHMAGNALMRLRRYNDAVAEYELALQDRYYDKRGALWANLAAAHAARGEYAEAIAAYEAALSESDYKTPHKAYQGMAGALLEMGRVEEAAAAYRKAALDEVNPNPGAALVNLGLCFMALGRPGDAAEAYKAALGFDTYAGRGKAMANLGQAYHALGQHADAVRTFEGAQQLYGHILSAAAKADYEASLAAVEGAQGPRPSREIVEGWVTGEIPPVSADHGAHDEVAAVETAEAAELGTPSGGATTPESERGPASAEPTPSVAPDVGSAEPGVAAYGGGAVSGATLAGLPTGEDDGIEAFLARTDAEMRERDKELQRAKRRARRAERNAWVPVFTVAGVLLGIVLVLAALYFSGYGWPTQQSTTKHLLDAAMSDKSTSAYWVAVPARDVEKEMAKIPPAKAFSLDSVQSGVASSTVIVTVTPENGSPLRYRITLQREGVGWKVAGIENQW